jgi:predicted lipoprotein
VRAAAERAARGLGAAAASLGAAGSASAAGRSTAAGVPAPLSDEGAGTARLPRAARGTRRAAGTAPGPSGAPRARGVAGRAAALAAATLLALAPMARADEDAAPARVADHAAAARRAAEGEILPAQAAFAVATADFATRVDAFCAGGPRGGADAAHHAAWDAWMAVAHLRFGPLDRGDRAFALAFWPDERGATPRALARLVATAEPAALSPAAFAEQPVSARGLTAADWLLSDPGASFDGADGARRCAVLRAVAADLAATAAAVESDWRLTWGPAMVAPAPAEGALYRSAEEATRELRKALTVGLDLAAQRLSRPLGEKGRPAPRRAEAWRSGRSLRNLDLSLAALDRLARATLAADLPPPRAAALADAFATARAAVAAVPPPLDAAVTTAEGRAAVEAALRALRNLRAATDAAATAALGGAMGFNALDGD